MWRARISVAYVPWRGTLRPPKRKTRPGLHPISKGWPALSGYEPAVPMRNLSSELQSLVLQLIRRNASHYSFQIEFPGIHVYTCVQSSSILRHSSREYLFRKSISQFFQFFPSCKINLYAINFSDRFDFPLYLLICVI